MKILAGPRRRYRVICYAEDLTIVMGKVSPDSLVRPGIKTEYDEERNTTLCRERIHGSWLVYERDLGEAMSDACRCLEALSAEPLRRPDLPITPEPSTPSNQSTQS